MKITEKTRKTIAVIELFSAALIWGSTFVTMKNTLDSLSPGYLLAVRFLIAAAFLFIICIPKLKKLTKAYIIPSALVGLFTAVAYILQTYGLKYTTPGKNAFLTSIYCVLVPFFYWIVTKKRPGIYSFTAAFICVLGVGLVSIRFSGGFSIGIGEILTLCCSVFYALQIMFMEKYSKTLDTGLLVALHFLFGSAYCFAFTGIFEREFVPISVEMLPDMLYLAIFASAIALLFQNNGVKYCSAAGASLILSLESVFGVVFSAIAGMEDAFTVQKIIGFVLVFSAIIISETKLEFLRRKKS